MCEVGEQVVVEEDSIGEMVLEEATEEESRIVVAIPPEVARLAREEREGGSGFGSMSENNTSACDCEEEEPMCTIGADCLLVERVLHSIIGVFLVFFFFVLTVLLLEKARLQ